MPELKSETHGPIAIFLKKWLGIEFASRIYIYSLIVGAVSGVGAIIFTYFLELAGFVFVEKLAGFRQVRPDGEVHLNFSFLEAPTYPEHLWVLLLLPALGALLSGWLVYRFAPEAEGHGTDAMIDAFHNGKGVIRPIVPLVKAVATILTLGSGGSAGKEGPVAQIGAGLGSWLASLLKLTHAQRRILLLAGTAGGLGAIFRAPLGGAITSVEILYREDFESDALIPCVISSIVAYSIYTLAFGSASIFSIPELKLSSSYELGLYVLLGVVCVVVGILYVKVFYGMRDRFFKKLSLPPYLVVALGGLLVGVVGLLDPRAMGAGLGVIQEAIYGHIGLSSMLLLVLLKILATSFTISSGGSGGVFGPSLFIGGMLGGCVGLVGQHFFPDIVQEPGAYVIVGMAAFFAGVANAPLGALIMVTEMSGGYHLLPPLMLVCAFALIFARNFSIYKNQVQNKFHSPAHIKDVTVNVLQNLRVNDVFDRLQNTSEAIVSNGLSYFSLSALSKKLGHVHFVVVDEAENLRGLISLEDLDLPEDDFLRNLVLIEDMVVDSVQPIDVTEDLHEALQKLLDCGYDKLPVVRREEEGEEVFLGYMMYQDLMRVYHQEVQKMEAEE
ncbi:MAG: chloride channel protein [Candidatus Latescibacterota bacterium]|jgi:CIC family chloride channel protein